MKTVNETLKDGLCYTSSPTGLTSVARVLADDEVSKWCVYLDGAGVPCVMEHDDMGEKGSLIIEDNTLIDYDGCFSLPKAIKKLLVCLGYSITDMIDEGDYEWIVELKRK